MEIMTVGPVGSMRVFWEEEGEASLLVWLYYRFKTPPFYYYQKMNTII